MSASDTTVMSRSSNCRSCAPATVRLKEIHPTLELIGSVNLGRCYATCKSRSIDNTDEFGQLPIPFPCHVTSLITPSVHPVHPLSSSLSTTHTIAHHRQKPLEQLSSHITLRWHQQVPSSRV